MKKIAIISMIMMLVGINATAQRTTDKLDRGLVAVPSGTGSFVSWRIFAEEYYDTEYNLYRDGTKVNDKPLTVSNYTDTGGKSGSTYQVAAVVRGVEQEKCAAVTRLNQQYVQFAVKDLWSRNGTRITNDYQINDIALADVDGDGVSEFIVKRNYIDKLSIANDTAFNCLECYNLKGERLWWIDLGPNMVSGPDEQYDAVGYDWDGDGKAEVLMRGADNMIIHHPDGTTTNIGNMNVNTRNTVNQEDGNLAYTNYGNEYLLYLEGSTGKPYSIGSGSTPLWMTYPLPRGNANDWGDGYGHRSTKHYFGAPFLDGRHPFIFLGRGCYTKHHMKAFSVDPVTHQLNQYWEWNSGTSGVWFGNGYHNFGIADVDWDGRDEICFGSMVIDDNGKGLSTTGLGHGDAQHCSDFDPYRHGQEIFACNEDKPAMNYRDATTSKIYYRLQSTSDDGRAICGNFSNAYPGCIGHSSQSGVVSTVADKVITGAPNGFAMNFRIYWDGDLLEEALDGASSREGASKVFKADGTQVFLASGTANCNWTKNTPSATGDILGDWREEIIARTTDNRFVRIYTTNIATKWRNYTLWHDHQYRQGMVWESIGYNQPPHTSYFLGELEDITVAPPPLTMTGRTEVANNGTIGSTLNDQHVIVCETNDTKVTVAEGAKPYMVTFNVPSWIQGTNSTITNGNAKIDRTYYTCTVEGAAFTGDMRLVKQGDGVLNLPKAAQTYTGETNIWAGTLNFDGTLLQSPLWLNRFAELNSDGGEFKSIKMDYASILRPGRENNRGNITSDSIMLGFGSRVIFDIYDDLTADQLITRAMKIETKNWEYGPQYLMPIFQFDYQGTDNPAPGKYLIGEVKTLDGDLSDIRIEGVTTKLKTALSLEDGKLYLVILGMRDATTIQWTGNEDTVWDMANMENFTNSSGETDFFVSGDNVLFNDSAKQFSVNLTGDLEADTVMVDNTKAFFFKGAGNLTGNTVLVKQGTGILTISNDNTYTGGNRLSGGIVSVSSLSNANQAKGNLGGVTTTASKFVMENGAELRTTAAVTNGSPIKFESEEGGVINNTKDFIVDKAMSGTVLTKKGSGWMKLNVSNSGLSRLIIAAGTVQCVNANTPAKTVQFSGGTLSENAGTSYTIDVTQGRTGIWNLVNDATYTNRITGKGTLTISCPVRTGGSGSSKWYATRTRVAVNLSDFEGTLKPISNGDASGRFTFDTAKGMPNGTMSIASGVEVQNTGKVFSIGKVTGSGSLGGGCTFSNGATVGANTWQVGCVDDFIFSGKVTGSGTKFTKVGTGKMTVSGKWDNTGIVNVNEGVLHINSSATLGTGSLTVAKGATLSGALLASSSLTNSSVTINGTLQPGATATSKTGSINFGNKNVTFANDSKLVINAALGATSSLNGCTSIAQINKLTMNGTIVITLVDNYDFEVGDSIILWQATTFSGTPVLENVVIDAEKGLYWDTVDLNKGILRVSNDASLGIAGIYTASKESPIYTIDGKYVGNKDNLLQPGIYIRNGKKIIIK